MRTFVCAVVALAIGAGVGLADDKKADKGKKGTNYSGVIKKIDAAAGTLTVTVKGKKGEEAKDMEFKVDDTTKVTVFQGEDKTTLSGKAGLKNDQFKEGAKVMVKTDTDNKVSEIQLGSAPKKKKDAK
jgi:hypothetical protein